MDSAINYRAKKKKNKAPKERLDDIKTSASAVRQQLMDESLRRRRSEVKEIPRTSLAGERHQELEPPPPSNLKTQFLPFDSHCAAAAAPGKLYHSPQAYAEIVQKAQRRQLFLFFKLSLDRKRGGAPDCITDSPTLTESSRDIWMETRRSFNREQASGREEGLSRVH